MISVEEALRQVLALAGPVEREEVPLDQAAGRVLAAPVTAGLSQPPFDSAMMDGYALRRADLAVGAQLRVVGEAAAGHALSRPIGPGEAARIFTGAPLPAGADCVLMQEDSTRAGEFVTITALPAAPYIRPRGHDFSIEDQILAPRLLDSRTIGLIAAMNAPSVCVARRPRVAIVATGDELVPPGTPPGPGQIICSNNYALAALARAAGAEAQLLPIAPDRPEALRDTLEQAARADLVVTIGGASVGDHDLVGKVAGEMGLERAFWKIAMRPGKPLMAGKLGASLMLGLPGNPVSSIVCGMIFMQPLIHAMQGLPPRDRSIQTALAVELPANGPRLHYMRARLLPGDRMPLAEPFADQDSGLLSVLSQADGLLIRPAHDAPRKAGDLLSFLPF